MAIREGKQWSSLCLENGLSSYGATAEEAIDRLYDVVSDAVEHELRDGPDASWAVSEVQLEEWLQGHEGPDPVVGAVRPVDEAG
jgi:hypothetical protein